MRRAEHVVYIDFLDNEYEHDDESIANKIEHQNLSDVAKIVRFACGKHDDGCTRTTINGTKQFCPFLDLYGGCAFENKLGVNCVPASWEFESNIRFENDDLVEEVF